MKLRFPTCDRSTTLNLILLIIVIVGVVGYMRTPMENSSGPPIPQADLPPIPTELTPPPPVITQDETTAETPLPSSTVPQPTVSQPTAPQPTAPQPTVSQATARQVKPKPKPKYILRKVWVPDSCYDCYQQPQPQEQPRGKLWRLLF